MFALWSLGCNQTPKNTIRISKQKIDYGTVIQGQLLTDRIALTNIGKSTIKILRLKKSCSCTSAKFDKNILVPGEVGFLQTSIDTGNKIGSIKSTVKIDWVTEEGLEGSNELHLAANVTAVAIITPGSIELGNLNVNSPSRTVFFTIYRGNSSFFWNSLAAIGSKNSAIEIKKNSPTEFRAKVILDPGAHPIGRLKEKISFKCLNKNSLVAEYAVTLNANITGPIRSEPQVIFLGVLPKMKEVSGTFRVISDTSNIELMSIQCDPEMEIFVKEISKNNISFRFLLSKKIGGNISKVVKLKLKMAGVQNLQYIDIPIFGYIRQ